MKYRVIECFKAFLRILKLPVGLSERPKTELFTQNLMRVFLDKAKHSTRNNHQKLREKEFCIKCLQRLAGLGDKIFQDKPRSLKVSL